MATYVELTGLASSADTLRQQVKAAIAKSALTITNEAPATTNHVQRLAWAKAALGNPDNEVDRVIWYVLAANAGATVQQTPARAMPQCKPTSMLRSTCLQAK